MGEVLFSQDALDHAAHEPSLSKRQPRKITTASIC